MVLVGGAPAARVGDFSMCITPVPAPNPIALGAFPVMISAMPAARIGDMATHPGSMITGPCCPTVLIGLAGVSGNQFAGTAACNAAASGRTSGSTAQSYNNCGLESTRQIANTANNSNASEDAWMTAAKNNPAVNNGNASFPTPIGTPGTPNSFAQGGTYPANQAALLAANGVPATVGSTADPAALPLAVAQGRGTVVNVDAAALWPTTTAGTANPQNPAPGAWHAILVTGIEYDDNGNIRNYIVNDTGVGQCGVPVPAATLKNAMGAYHTPGQGMVTTNSPIW
jgi:hypothetical protein